MLRAFQRSQKLSAYFFVSLLPHRAFERLARSCYIATGELANPPGGVPANQGFVVPVQGSGEVR